MYPFGMQMPGRNYSTDKYRYSINGQERTPELGANFSSAEFWQYDARIARRLNIDPLCNEFESPYLTFSGNPVYYSDPSGATPEDRAKAWAKKNGIENYKFSINKKGNGVLTWVSGEGSNLTMNSKVFESATSKPSRFTRFLRSFNNDYYQSAAEDFANENDVPESNIINLHNDTWVVPTESNGVRQLTIFRKQSPTPSLISSGGSEFWYDKQVIKEEDIYKTQITGREVIIWTPGAGGAAKVGLSLMGKGGRLTGLYIVGQSLNKLANWRKLIRFGVNHEDILIKGYHLHFDNLAKGLEMGMVPLAEGKIGLVQVGKSSGTAMQVANAVKLFEQAIKVSGFRTELLVRLKATQEYLLSTYKGMKNYQQAVDKAHEINYLLKAVLKYE